MRKSKISIDVVYALPERQVLRRLRLPKGSRLSDALRSSALLGEFPEIDPARVGIYGKAAGANTVLRDRDRVEIYRPLEADPKEIRRRRAVRKSGRI